MEKIVIFEFAPQNQNRDFYSSVCNTPTISPLDFGIGFLNKLFDKHLSFISFGKHHQIQSGEKSEKSRVAQIFNANEGSNRKFVPKVILCVQFPLVHSVLFHSSLTRRQNKVDFVKCLKLLLLEKTMMMRATSITLASFLLS